jgi:hypothetical protein
MDWLLIYNKVYIEMIDSILTFFLSHSTHFFILNELSPIYSLNFQ